MTTILREDAEAVDRQPGGINLIIDQFQPKFTFSMSTKETPEQYVKLFKVNNKDARMMSLTPF